MIEPLSRRVRRQLGRVVHASMKHPSLETALVGAQRGLPTAMKQPWSMLFPQPSNYSSTEQREVMRGGLRWNLRPAHYNEWHHYFELPNPPLDLLKTLARPGDVVVDAGANVGIFSLEVARCVGPSGRVLAIEPHPATFERLQEHLRLNGLTNIVSVCCAVGAGAGTARLYESASGDSGRATIIEEGRSGRFVDVEVRPLDDLLVELDVPSVQVIKIDVEGLEPEVLLGSTEALTRDRPLITFEFTPRWSASRHDRLRDAEQLLRDMDYTLFALRNQAGLTLDEIGELSSLSFDTQYNLVAVPRSRQNEILARCR